MRLYWKQVAVTVFMPGILGSAYLAVLSPWRADDDDFCIESRLGKRCTQNLRIVTKHGRCLTIPHLCCLPKPPLKNLTTYL